MNYIVQFVENIFKYIYIIYKMSAYNKTFYDNFYVKNKSLFSTLDKFKNVDINNYDTCLNKLKLTINDIKKIHKNINNNNRRNIINYEPNKLTLFSDKCYDNFETEYKGTISTVSNNITNSKNIKDKNSDISLLLNLEYLTCRDPNKYKRVIVFKNKLNITLLDFSTSNFSGRKYYRYLFTKLILGDDYNLQNKTNGFYNDGTLGQEIIYYFLEIYCYDRYNFFKKLAINSYNDEIPQHVQETAPLFPALLANINELLVNKNWKNDYPPIDGVTYFDKSPNSKYGIEIVIYTSEISLELINSIYINDGTNFVNKREDVTVFNPKTIDFIKLEKIITLSHKPSNIKIIEGGDYKSKYLKYKKKLNGLNINTN